MREAVIVSTARTPLTKERIAAIQQHAGTTLAAFAVKGRH